MRRPTSRAARDDLEGELERIGVGAAVGRVVEVVELAHRGDAGAGHLQEALAGGDGEPSGSSAAAARYIVSRQVQKSSRAASGAAAWVRPRRSRWKAWLWAFDQAREEQLAGKAFEPWRPGAESPRSRRCRRGRWPAPCRAGGGPPRGGRQAGASGKPWAAGHPSNALVAGARGRAHASTRMRRVAECTPCEDRRWRLGGVHGSGSGGGGAGPAVSALAAGGTGPGIDRASRRRSRWPER